MLWRPTLQKVSFHQFIKWASRKGKQGVLYPKSLSSTSEQALATWSCIACTSGKPCLLHDCTRSSALLMCCWKGLTLGADPSQRTSVCCTHKHTLHDTAGPNLEQSPTNGQAWRGMPYCVLNCLLHASISQSHVRTDAAPGQLG